MLIKPALLILTLVLLAAYPLVADAQQIGHVGYAFPAGARQGATVSVTVGGQFLASAKSVYASGEGVKGTVTGYTQPIKMKEAKALFDQLELAYKRMRADGVRVGYPSIDNLPALQRIAKEAGVSDADLQALIVFRRNQKDTKRQPNMQIAEMVTVEVKVDEHASPGPRDLRLITATGLTNPVRFIVGRLPEFQEATKDDTSNELGDTLPVLINGQVLPGSVDHYTFRATKGMHLVVDMQAQSIIPYLADAVPGWFQGSIALFDPKGEQIAFADHNLFHQDPVFYVEIPADGKYRLDVRDALYRGREDFVYRVTIGETPYLTGIFPLGGPAAAKTDVALYGYNLPEPVIALSPTVNPGVSLPISLTKGDATSNTQHFAVGRLPEVGEKEPNETLATAQPVTLPIVINGRTGKPRDADVYQFVGKAGDKVVAEVVARRLNSPLDSILVLSDAKGKVIATNDDTDDKGAGLVTHNADSYVSATLPAAGKYYVTVRNTESDGGPLYGYRLRISPPQPGFDLRIVPSAFSGRPNSTVTATVYAIRRDGFAGEITLALKDAPPAFSLGTNTIPAGADKATIQLKLPIATAGKPVRLSMEGTATIDGKPIAHPVVPAEDMMQAFAYRHLVPVDDLLALVIGRYK
ncbi:MAG TPA: PPC domain-containing protein [Capsulimonadaceae bacterium]|jgi:hypothetical protein